MHRLIILFSVFSVVYLSGFHTSSTIAEATYPKAEFSEEYDEFEDEIEKSLKVYFGRKGQPPTTFDDEINVIQTTKKNDSSDSTRIIWFLMAKDKREYDECNKTIFIINGERFQPTIFYRAKRYSQAGMSILMESLFIVEDDKLINLLTQTSENVRFRICNDEYYLPKVYLKEFIKVM
jgi:hypothetical protein